ncbi:Uncharacterized protein Adt_47509 [Abeliophyllum distichum]|uniref:Uncharacterized protein n=1 Tax=Abeliophyllum distichum TaxID=126358 RepID=A0ABD1NTP3_9LAMI
MADVMSHECDGAWDLPQQPPHRLASAYESAPPPKRWGISRCINLEKVWQANRKRPLTMQLIRNNAKYFTRLVRNQMRFNMPPCYPSWTESYFDLQADRSPDQYRAVYAVVDRLAANRYRDYKLKEQNHLKAHGSS